MEKIMRDLVALDSTPLYAYRVSNDYQPVIGEGDAHAKIMFVGEAPGKTEALTGKPFCGASGKFLNIMLASIGLDRTRVYITNIVKDRPPENRDPTPAEIAAYGPLLDRQIESIKPKVIATLGRYSMAYIMKRFGLEEELDAISELHGRKFSAKASYGRIQIVTLYHPAAALYNGGMRAKLIADFEVLKKFV